MIPEIKELKYKKNFIYHIRFKNDCEGDIDLKPFLWGEAFEMLKDPTFFQKAFVDKDSGTITWPNGTDIAPETLYEKIAEDFSYL